MKSLLSTSDHNESKLSQTYFVPLTEFVMASGKQRQNFELFAKHVFSGYMDFLTSKEHFYKLKDAYFYSKYDPKTNLIGLTDLYSIPATLGKILGF